MESGLELKIRRIRLGMKGVELASLMNIDQSHISRMENGKRSIPEKVYEKWNEVLHEYENN